jgi:TrpR-related protein YerC/YecD
MDWNTKENRELIDAILALKDPEEAKSFLRDLMTEGEIQEFSKRLLAAKMLTNKISYIEIEKQTGLSSTTIARVSKWLNGKGGGYKTILNKIHHHNSIQTGRGLS